MRVLPSIVSFFSVSQRLSLSLSLFLSRASAVEIMYPNYQTYGSIVRIDNDQLNYFSAVSFTIFFIDYTQYQDRLCIALRL